MHPNLQGGGDELLTLPSGAGSACSHAGLWAQLNNVVLSSWAVQKAVLFGFGTESPCYLARV